MNEPIKELITPCLLQWGFYPSSDTPQNREGHCYKLSEALGEGYYWYYQREGMFAIALMDICLKEDMSIEYKQPDFISITCYDSVSAEQLNSYKRLNANCVKGHVSNSDVYRGRYHKSVPICGMELMLVPGYFNDYLSQKYPNQLPNIKEIFMKINDIANFPELLILMRQLQGFHGTGISAHLFYESKVAEIISLILEKTVSIQNTSYSSSKDMSLDDIQNLDIVKSYISDHFTYNLHVEQLAKMACMSQSKLRYCFKRMCGCTITEFIQNKRMAHAEYMLLKTDLQINQIAKAVGYHHAGRFSKLFQTKTGLLPEEYRKLLKHVNNNKN